LQFFLEEKQETEVKKW